LASDESERVLGINGMVGCFDDIFVWSGVEACVQSLFEIRVLRLSVFWYGSEEEEEV
jgi:hypothetical protein